MMKAAVTMFRQCRLLVWKGFYLRMILATLMRGLCCVITAHTRSNSVGDISSLKKTDRVPSLLWVA